MKNKLETILVIVTGFTILFLLTKIKLFVDFAVLIGIVSLASDYVAGKISYFWENLSLFLGKITSKIILSFVFFVFLFPLAILAKIFSKEDNLALKQKVANSFYIVRDHVYSKDDLEKAW